MALLGLSTKERPALGGLYSGCELQACTPAGPPPQQLCRRLGKTRPPRNSQIVSVCDHRPSSFLFPLSPLPAFALPLSPPVIIDSFIQEAQ